MEENVKKSSFNGSMEKIEFATNFFEKYSYETDRLEKSIVASYDGLWQKFLTLVEKDNSQFCRVNQIEKPKKVCEKKINTDNKVDKKFEKLIESFEHVNTNEKSSQIKPVFRSEQKNQTFSKPNDLTIAVNAKKNLNFVKKPSQSDELQLKMHPPLASSSILVHPESEIKYSFPIAPSNNLLNDFSKNLNTSGKVKQIVKMVEDRMKVPVKQTHSIASKLIKYNSQIQSKEKIGARLSNNFKKKTGLIEQKKVRNSISNQEQKRKSLRKVNAILKHINEDNVHEKKYLPQKITADSRVKPPAQPPNTKSLKANIQKVPSFNAGAKAELKPTSTSVNNLYNLKTKEKSNFAKFLQRNTPVKLSRAELLAKEKKEQERLNEREKLVHEKVEIAKKKREERMKKIADLKHKNEMDIQKRQDEINAAKAVESSEFKKKMNESDKKSHESEKSKELVKQAIKLPETMTGIVKNSPFQKFDKQTSIKENKIKSDLTHKIKSVATFTKHDHIKPFTQCEKNNCKQIKNLDEKKEPVYEDYGIQDLHSSDETDDDEEPTKPIPNWAKDPGFTKMAKQQAYRFINFTKLFKKSAQINIDLGEIFEKKKNNFYQRSSSAIWNSSPIWNTSGIHGNESFMQTHKN